MPSPRAFLRAVGARHSVPRRVVRVAGVVALVALALCCTLLLTVRFVVFPRVEDYRGDLTAALSRQLKQPVEIDALSAGWDGWNPKVVIHGFRVRSAASPASSPLLDLPQVEMVVAWTSLPLFDLRLKKLALDEPRLAVRRDRAGMLHVAGIEFDPGRAGDDAPLTDWVLRQPHIDIHDALITWNDDLRNAPQLTLDHVQVRLESRFGRHRFGLLGVPPVELAAPIDVRGDVRRGPNGSWQTATGRIYVRLDYADIAASSEWLPLPVPIASGKGALRMWFDFAGGEPTEVVADLELADVKAKLGPDLPELALASLSGRAGWRADLPRREFYTRALAFVTAGGQRFDPTDLTVTLREVAGTQAGTGLVEFDRVQLAPLRDLAAHLPMPARLRSLLALYAPRGTLTRGRFLWEGQVDAPEIYSAATDFSDVGIAAQGALPGVEGLTGRLEMTQATGDVKLTCRGAALDLPQLFAKPIPFDSLSGGVNWTRTAGRTAIEIERLEFANADAAGRASGKFRTAPDGPGEIDLSAALTRASVAQVHRYLPRAVQPGVRDWLRAGLVKGTSPEVKLRLAGNLADFPFTGGKSGTFTVTAKARDVVLDYARGWPVISELDGDVSLTGTKLTVDATRGRVSGVPLGKVRAEIGDLRAERPPLVVDGEVAGPTADFLRFVETSPVAGWIGRATDGMRATGDGRLYLKLAFPLGDPAGNKVAGEYQFVGNDLRITGVPPLTQINGRLAFTEAGVRAQDLAADILGGPARLAVANVDGETRVTGGGNATVAALRREFDPPYGDAITGSLDWTIAVAIRGDGHAWTIESNLKGSAIDLPAPLGKAAGEAVALKVERHGTPAQPNEDLLTVAYGNVGRVLLHRKLAADGAAVDRALLLLGRAAADPAARPERAGVWVRGELPTLNFDDWLALQRRAPPGAGGDGAPVLAGIDLDVETLEAFGRRFRAMKLGARRTQDDWRLELQARELAGTATWSAPSPAAPNGLFAARLSRLVPPDAGEFTPWKGAAGGPAKAEAGVGAGVANPWPGIDVVAESYLVRGREIGRLEFVAHPRGSEWLIDRMTLANDGGRVSAQGQWRSAGRDQQTRLDVDLDLKETGKFLSRIGYADAVQNAPTRVKGELAWAGAPNDFDYPTLSGAFRIEVGPGRFTKIDPGIGKLLGVLSLQSLPRRITLDFTDVFSEGFAFDEINGDVRIRNGVLMSDDLRLAGPAAKVNISGSADLAHETQQLTVRVQPALSGGISAGAMLLLLANPVIGAAVGAGSLLAQKVLRDPIEQMFSYEYQVTGSWSDPVVTRKTAVAAAAGAGSPTK